MNNNLEQSDNEELTKLEILRVFKKRFAGEQVNHSPFAEDRVVRYDTDVKPLDVPKVHQDVRVEIEKILTEIHTGHPSKIVILAGEPGMGKSHLLNHYRDLDLAQSLGYVLVGNSNHWSVQEFEPCLLDWILDALIRPSPHEPHLLLDKIQDIAFEALRQILDRPGHHRSFFGKKDAGFWRRQWDKLFGAGPARYRKALADRDPSIFRRLHFDEFAKFVIDRFLPTHASKPFHRYVLKCLLLYLFPEEREKVIHWLRRKKVEAHFVKRLGMGENIETQFQVINTIQILISLFSPAVSRVIQPQPEQYQGLVFFFAFDQMEGRNELFDKDTDWFDFFAKLSELYNTLPNIFFMFTMTLHLRNRLYPMMERQFRSRIVRSDKFLLKTIPPEEILAVYQSRILHWLGDSNAETLLKLEDSRFRFLPFRADDVVEISHTKTLREFLVEIDDQFREYLDTKVVVNDPRFEYLVSLNELREKAQGIAKPFEFSKNHLGSFIDLMKRTGGSLASGFNLRYCGMKESETKDGTRAVCLEFQHPANDKEWICVFVVRLPFVFARLVDGCIELLANKRKEQYFLWLVRPEKIDSGIEARRPAQVRGRILDTECECRLQAMLRMLDKSERFKGKQRKHVEQVIREELKQTYLGEMFEEIANRLGVTADSVEPVLEIEEPVEMAEAVEP